MSSRYTYGSDVPVKPVDCRQAFKQLPEEYKLYAHYLTKACSSLYLINLSRNSPSSPLIFLILYKLFEAESFDELRAKAVELGLSDNDFDGFLIFAAYFLENNGNHSHLDGSKIIPVLSKELFVALVKKSEAFKSESRMAHWLENCIDDMYSLSEEKVKYGFSGVGVTGFLSNGITSEDADAINAFACRHNLELFNSRAFKHPNGKIEIRYASSLPTESEKNSDYLKSCDDRFFVTRGDHSVFLEQVNKYLREASKYGSKLQKEMIEKYIEHFESGDVEIHKQASKLWVKDLDTPVDSYIGFIETYGDPAQMRAFFDPFVVLIDLNLTGKYQKLVDDAQNILKLLPWGPSYERETFQKPVYSSTDVLFKSDFRVVGQNIPNYDAIRQNHGFKNLGYDNIINSRFSGSKFEFISPEDIELFKKYHSRIIRMDIALHELIGHGSGKLFSEDETGKLNFDETVKTLSGETVLSRGKWYRPGETYEKKFGKYSGVLEELRAITVAIVLSNKRQVLSLFGFETEQDQNDAMKVALLSMVLSAISRSFTFDPTTGEWKQVHSEGYFYQLRSVLKKCPDFIKFRQFINENDNEPDLQFTIDMDKASQAVEALEELLLKINFFKATADNESFIKLSHELRVLRDDLEHPYLQFREIALKRVASKMVFQLGYSEIVDGKAEYYFDELSPENCLKSHLKNIPKMENLVDAVEQEWKKDKNFFY